MPAVREPGAPRAVAVEAAVAMPTRRRRSKVEEFLG